MAEDDIRERSRRTLEAAKAAYEANPDEANYTWYGRVLGFRYRFDDAIAVFSKGLSQFPDSAQLLRQRGHRYLSTRQFDAALADMSRAAALIEGLPYWVEPDGPGNELPVPQTSLQFNTYYHLGLAHYFLRDFAKAAEAFARSGEWAPADDYDGITAAADWVYMSLRRSGDEAGAEKVLERVPAGLPDEAFVEGPSYYRRLRMYKGELAPDDLLNPEKGTQQVHGIETIIATQGYGVANWYLYNGQVDEAKALYTRILEGRSTSAFGYIAAELDMAELAAGSDSPGR